MTYRLQGSTQAVEVRANDPAAEVTRLDAAIAAVDAALARTDALLRDEQKDAEADVFAAHRMLLGDPSLRERLLELIRDERLAADSAMYRAGEEQALLLLELDDPYLSARAADVRDVVGQVQRTLRGESALGDRLSGPAIIVAADLGPSDLMSVPRERLLGFALLAGGLTAHAIILARGLGIPAVIGLGEAVADRFSDGVLLALDGSSGEVVLSPAPERLTRLRQAAEAATVRQAELRARRDLATVTRDGHSMTLVANASTPAEARLAAEWGAAGIGLLRTELLFLERATLPSEDEQFALYRAIAAELPGRPIVVRTLDVGGDKELPAFPLPKEDNPFLGWRGIRIGLSRPEILLPQLRALLRASAMPIFGSCCLGSQPWLSSNRLAPCLKKHDHRGALRAMPSVPRSSALGSRCLLPRYRPIAWHVWPTFSASAQTTGRSTHWPATAPMSVLPTSISRLSQPCCAGSR
ncbi:phosphoenolpyruvate--protein phosphotransferase [Candidatus Gracilibacteria bacterium]|nr:phosphoenolpyruvate--protein phosphotransferase [Candidatus Gracilibacteria bacterium]